MDRGRSITSAEEHPAVAVSRQKLGSGQSIYLGRESATSVGLFGAKHDHALVLGPPRSGKTSGIIIPSVGIHPGPVIVTSTRDDVIAATKSARRAISEEFGGSVREVIFGGAASGVVPISGWSITDGCANWNTARDRANTLAAAAISNPTDRFWRNAGAELLAACLFAAALLGEDDQALAQRLSLQDLHDYHALTYAQCPSGHPAPGVFKRFEEGSGAMADDTRASVFATVTSQILSQLGYELPMIDHTIDIDEFVRSWGTIYLTVPGERAENLGPLVTAFVAAVVTAWTNARRRSEGPPGTLLLALDEVANIAPLPTLPSIITSGAGDGVQCLLGMQEPGQASRWGSEASVILGSTTHLAVFRGLTNSSFLTGLSQLQPAKIKYDVKVKVKPETPFGPRLADEATLIAERQELELAMGVGNDRQRHFRAKKAAAAITARRLRSGVQSRIEDADSTVSAVLLEIMSFTTVHNEPDRRSSFEPNEIAEGRENHCFIASNSQGVFRYVIPWNLDPIWEHLLSS